jgi:hypothetical protein
MSVQTVLKTYLSVKRHFTAKTSNAIDVDSLPPVRVATKTTQNPFLASRCRLLYRTYSTQELPYVFAANFAAGDVHGGLYSPDCVRVHQEWEKRNASLSAYILEDLHTLKAEEPSVKKWMQGYPPLGYQIFLQRKITPETFTMLMDEERFRNSSTHIQDNIIGDALLTARRYRIFVSISNEAVDKLFEEVLS